MVEGNCGTCNRPVKSNQSGIQCDLCQIWFHAKCCNANEQLVKFLESEAGQSSNLHWYCRSCEAGSRRILEKLVVMDERLSTVENQVGEIKGKLDQLDSKLDGTSKKNDNPKPQFISEVVEEIREREKRALNVVFSGEVTKEKVDRFVEVQGGESPSKVLEVETKSKKKLYIVTLKSERQKWALIGKAKQITQSTEGLKDIYVNPDLTKSEREIQFNLREEVRRRRLQGESVKIKRGKIVASK